MVPTSVGNSISKSDTPPRKRVRSTLSSKINPNEYCHCTHTWGTYGGPNLVEGFTPIGSSPARALPLAAYFSLPRSSRHNEQYRNSRRCCPVHSWRRGKYGATGSHTAGYQAIPVSPARLFVVGLDSRMKLCWSAWITRTCIEFLAADNFGKPDLS